MSEKNLYQKVAEIMGRVGYTQKDSTNPHFKYKYVSAEAILKKINEELSAAGIAVESRCTLLPSEGDVRTVHLSLTLTDGTGRLTFEGLGSGQDKGDKGVMKALTAAHKYAYATGMCMSWGDDPEADASTDKASEKATAPAAAEIDWDALIKNAKTEQEIKEAKNKIRSVRKTDEALYSDLVKRFKEAHPGA